MEYVVIETGGKQYKASEGTILEVDNLKLDDASDVSFDKVLLHVKEDGSIEVGKPYVAGLAVTAKILENFKGKKVRTAKFLHKSKYRKVRGFRAQLSRVQIGGIVAKKSKPDVQSAPKNDTKVKDSTK